MITKIKLTPEQRKTIRKYCIDWEREIQARSTQIKIKKQGELK